MRRTAGTGCIYKNQNNKWVLKIPVGYDKETKRTSYKQIGTFDKKEYALRAAEKYVELKWNGYLNITLKEVMDDWIKNYENSPKSTYCNYKTAIEKLEPLHNYKVKDITYNMLNDFFQHLDTNRELTLAVLKLVYTEIEKSSNVKNIARLIKLPKKEKTIIRKEFTSKEINQLFYNSRICMNNEENSFKYDVILFYIFTGLRASELITIKPEDVFLDKGYFMCYGTKTDSSVRAIPIHDDIRYIVEHYYNKDNKYLFAHTRGRKSYKYDGLHESFKKVCEELGTEHTMHDTRHTFATLLAKSGANIYSIKKLLGHSVNDVTFGIYVHEDINSLREVVNKIDYRK